MKAIILENQTTLLEGEFAMPQPKAHEVLIEIKASGFNPIDYQMLENEQERKLIRSPILGRELAGTIVALGAQISHFKVGDDVYCAIGSMGSNGSYATHVSAPEAIVAFKPRKLSFEEAAVVPSAGITALQIFNRLSGNWHKKIFLTGASGAVGSFLLQLLKVHGFERSITATYGSKASFEKLKKLGLMENQLIDYKKKNWERDLKNDTSFDLCVDLVGNKLAETAASVLLTNGIYVDVTALTTAEAREVLFNKGIVVIHVSNYAYAMDGNYAYYKNSLQQLSRWFDDDSLQAPDYEVVGNLSLETVHKAHHKLKNNQTNAKKLAMKHSV